MSSPYPPHDPMGDADAVRYAEHMHAVQTGVALDLHNDPTGGEPKHLRVGVNSAFVGIAALATLLIERGVFTLAEYAAANADEAEAEHLRYEQRLGVRLH